MNFIKGTEQYDYSIYLNILGKDITGKTSFLKRIKLYDDYKSFNEFTTKYNPTDSIDIDDIFIKYNNKIFKFILWDSSGQDIYRDFVLIPCKMGDCILIFYDALNKESFEKAKVYYEEALKVNKKNAIYFLIRSKYDLKCNSDNNEIVSDEEALKFADKNNLIFAHISPLEKDENGINEIFEIILKEYILKNTNN